MKNQNVLGDQATKGNRWMPRGREPTKGVAHDDTPRGAASRLRSGGSRMGQPSPRYGGEPVFGRGATGGTETSQYPEEEKATAIPLVVASERGPA